MTDPTKDPIKAISEAVEKEIERLLAEQGATPEEIAQAKATMQIQFTGMMPSPHRSNFTKKLFPQIVPPAIEVYEDIAALVQDYNFCSEGFCSSEKGCFTLQAIYTALLMALCSHLGLEEIPEAEIKSVLSRIINDLYKVRKNCCTEQPPTKMLQ